MPATEGYPFERVMVNHLFYGVTRIWWEMHSEFTDAAPYTFQLQASYTGNDTALDWVDIGTSAINPQYMEDDGNREPAGKRLLTHYRLVLTTAQAVYRSSPAPIWGILSKRDWLLAREIIRKEQLRHSMVSCEGFMVRRMRYGVQDPNAVDPLTEEVIDSKNRSSWGTPYKVGYHPPVPFTMDVDNETITEYRGGADVTKHSSRPTSFIARVIAFPEVAKEDFWVDEDTDQRYVIHDIKSIASWRGVPLVNQLEIRLAPHSDIIYRIPTSPDAYDPGDGDPFQPTVGDGCVRVDHNYPTDDNLTYQMSNCCGIAGANIYVFTKEDWDGGARTPENAVAASITTTNGEWAYAVLLNPGSYVVMFVKVGQYGPNWVALTVQPPDPGAPPEPDLSVSSSFSSEFGPI
jgi:hypothetical protein